MDEVATPELANSPAPTPAPAGVEAIPVPPAPADPIPESDPEFDLDQFRAYRESTGDSQSQVLAWKSIEVLKQHWAALVQHAPHGAQQDALSRHDLEQALQHAGIPAGDADILGELLDDSGAFSYLDRLDGQRDGRIEFDTLTRYALADDTRVSLLGDAPAIDIAYKGNPQNAQGIGNNQLSREDIQARINDPNTDEAQRTRLKAIDRDTYDLLRGNHRYIQVKDLIAGNAVAPAPTPAPTPIPGDAAKIGTALEENFGFVDTAAPGAKPDGIVTQADVAAAAKSTLLDQPSRQALQTLADNWDAYAGALTGKPGQSGVTEIHYTDLAPSAPPGTIPPPTQAHFSADYDLLRKRASDVPVTMWMAGKKSPNDTYAQPDILSVVQSPGFNTLADDTEKVFTLLGTDSAALNNIDRLDGNYDGLLNGLAPSIKPPPSPTDWNGQVLNNTLANDGSELNVASAAMNALYQDYAGRYDQLSDDQKRLVCVLEAESALKNGIPLPNAATDLFPNEMSAVLDADKVDTALASLMQKPEIQQDYAAKIKSLAPDAAGTAQKIYDELTGGTFINALNYAKSTGNAQALIEPLGANLGILAILDPALAGQARNAILGELGWQAISSPDFGSFSSAGDPSGTILPSAVADGMAFLSDTAPGATTTAEGLANDRRGLRLTGNLATLVDEWPKTLAALGVTAQDLAGAAPVVSNAMSDVSNQGRPPTDAAAVIQNIEENPGADKVVVARAKSLVQALNQRGLWGTAAGVFGVAAGVYRLVGGGGSLSDTPWERVGAAFNFVASASYLKEGLKTGSWAVSAALGNDLQTPMFQRLGLNDTFPEVLTAAKQDGVFSVKALGAITKGLIAITDIGAGVLSNALGIKGIVDAAQNGGDAADYAQNIAFTLSGVSCSAAGVASLVGSALSTLGFVASGVFGVVGALIELFSNLETPAEIFAEGFDKRWGSNLGLDLLKPGAKDFLEYTFGYTHPSVFSWNFTNSAPPMGRLDGSAPYIRPTPFGLDPAQLSGTPYA